MSEVHDLELRTKRIEALAILVAVIVSAIDLTAKCRVERVKMIREMRECFAALGVSSAEIDEAMQ